MFQYTPRPWHIEHVSIQSLWEQKNRPAKWRGFCNVYAESKLIQLAIWQPSDNSKAGIISMSQNFFWQIHALYHKDSRWYNLEIWVPKNWWQCIQRLSIQGVACTIIGFGSSPLSTGSMPCTIHCFLSSGHSSSISSPSSTANRFIIQINSHHLS